MGATQGKFVLVTEVPDWEDGVESFNGLYKFSRKEQPDPTAPILIWKHNEDKKTKRLNGFEHTYILQYVRNSKKWSLGREEDGKVVYRYVKSGNTYSWTRA